MASPFDDLDRQHLVEIHKLVDTTLKVVAKLQDQVAKLAKVRTSDPNYRSRRYLRDTIRRQRESIATQKAYIAQLENELILRGLE